MEALFAFWAFLGCKIWRRPGADDPLGTPPISLPLYDASMNLGMASSLRTTGGRGFANFILFGHLKSSSSMKSTNNPSCVPR
jgi:hypothetical protein